MDNLDFFKVRLQAYIDEAKEVNLELAAAFLKETKNLDECILYIIDTVKKTGRIGFDDSEVFQMIDTYYTDDNIVINIEKHSIRIVSNQQAPSPTYTSHTNTPALNQQTSNTQKTKSNQAVNQYSLF